MWGVFVHLLLNWLWRVFNQAIGYFVFLHCELWELCSQSQIKHILAPKLCIYRVMDALGKFGSCATWNSYASLALSRLRYTHAKYELFCLLGTWTGQSEWQLVISQGMLVALILLFRLLILLLVCGTMDNVSPDVLFNTITVLKLVFIWSLLITNHC